jgi:putative oxidoreductase
MRRCFYPGPVGQAASIGLLFLRVVMGAAFILHGWPKIQHAFDWMPPEMNMPGFLQALAALAEFGGGIALILGLLTRIAALGIAVVMAVAAGMVHIPAGHPFVSTGGPSWELAGVYFAAAVLFLLAGPGRLSLDAILFGHEPVRPAL